MITKQMLKYAIINMAIAAFFGISLNMGITCMIPVSFGAIICAFYDGNKNNTSYLKSILNGAVPSIIGGLIIWLCIYLKTVFNIA